jgi:hypothetical protein
MAKPASSSADVAEDTWSAKAPMQEARGRLGVAAVNGKIYAIGGSALFIGGPMPGAYRHDIGSEINTTEEYDPATDTWIYKTPIPTPRANFGIAVHGGKIYCIGGSPYYNETGANEVYDPATDTWETKASIPTPTGFPTANIVEGKIYLISTKYSGNNLNQVYDPATDSWTTKTSPPTQIGSGASAVFDNKIYSINIDGFVQIYDPANDSWTVGEAMPTARGFAGAAVINDTIYVVGGVIFQYSGGYMGPTAVNEQYTPIGYGTVPPTKPTWLVYATAACASAIAVSAGLIVYFKKRRHKTSFAS